MIAIGELLMCKMCSRPMKTLGGLLSHITNTHRVTQEWYYTEYFKNPCGHCGVQIPFMGGVHARLRYVARRRFCSLRCAGDAVVRANEGRLNHDGYVLTHVRRFDEKYWDMLHPMRTSRSNKEQKILEHRAIMAITIGRALKPNEAVHHINGVRTDNRPENLELMVGTHCRGVRATDLVCPHCGGRYA